jgi:3-hydroxy-3-methylglutaryl CoA synthase/uncharacterized OB-fold protein
MGFDQAKVDAVVFVSTSSPFLEKISSAFLAAGLGLRSDVLALDITGSLAGLGVALEAGLGLIASNRARYVLIASGDCRDAMPFSSIEALSSDSGGAVLLGQQGVIAEFEGSSFLTLPILDTWQLRHERYLKDTEERFIQDKGYLSALPKAMEGLLKKMGAGVEDFAYAGIAQPDPRRLGQAAKALGFGQKGLLGEHLYKDLGSLGCSTPAFLLEESLQKMGPGDRALLLGYGDGAFAIALKAAQGIEKARPEKAPWLFRDVPSYTDILKWKEHVPYAPRARRPSLDPPSPISLFREREQNLALVGVRCHSCGYPQYPAQRVCTRCRGMAFAPEPFAQKRAALFTYSLDTLGPTPDPPLIVCFIDFEGGGRMQCLMTDADSKELSIGMPLDMTFRKLFVANGIPNYFWKCTPIRGGKS